MATSTMAAAPKSVGKSTKSQRGAARKAITGLEPAGGWTVRVSIISASEKRGGQRQRPPHRAPQLQCRQAHGRADQVAADHAAWLREVDLGEGEHHHRAGAEGAQQQQHMQLEREDGEHADHDKHPGASHQALGEGVLGRSGRAGRHDGEPAAEAWLSSVMRRPGRSGAARGFRDSTRSGGVSGG